MIIFLNGTSSSGKSLLAREMMRQSMRPLIYYSIDHLVNYWMDEKFVVFEGELKEWFYHESTVDEQGKLLTHIVDGPNAVQLHWDMIESLSVLIKKGYDLIIDEVLWKSEIFQRYCHALCQTKVVYLVKVICELIECERRENERDDRFKGLARSLYPQVYTSHPIYDLEIDTTYTESAACARKVLRFIDETPRPQGFLQSLKKMITFEPLTHEHFTLMQQWMNKPHVSTWWGEGKTWTFADIEEKYTSYVKGYKQIEALQKPIHAFIIKCGLDPIGYIQYYNAFDFPRDGYEIENVPNSVSSFDFYIGESDFIGKGLGATIIEQFLRDYVWLTFDSCFIDVDTKNERGIRVYEKAGFHLVKRLINPGVTCMFKIKPAISIRK